MRVAYHVFVLHQDRKSGAVITFGDAIAVFEEVVTNPGAWRRHRDQSIRRVLGGMRVASQRPRTFKRSGGAVTFVAAESGLTAVVVRTKCNASKPVSGHAAFAVLREHGIYRGPRGSLPSTLRPSFRNLASRLAQTC